MAIVMNMKWEGVTPEVYEAFWIESKLDSEPPAGGIHHVSWFEEGTLKVQDVWESTEAFQAFTEARLMPVAAALNIAGQPEVTIHPAQRVFAPGYAK